MAGGTRRGLRLVDPLRSVVFFGLLYVFLWLAVRPCLIYSCASLTNFPVFYQGWEFFRDAMSYPGGLLRYLSALLPQFFYHSWAGALVITAQAWAICACMGCFFRALAVPGWRLLRFVPALLVLMTYTQYSYHFPTIMGALASLLVVCAYVSLVPRRASLGSQTRFIAFGDSVPARQVDVVRGRTTYEASVYFALSVISYAISAAAYLHFAGLCALYELLYRRRYALGLWCLLLAAVLPYVEGVLLFRVSVIDAYREMLPFSWHVRGWVTREKMVAAVYALYLFPIALAFAWGLWRLVRDITSAGHTETVRSTPYATVRWLVGSALLFTGAGATAFGTLDREQKALLEVHHYACHRMWPQVLQAARGCSDRYVAMNAVNRALYHTGRLTRDMFVYPQHPEALLLNGEDHVLTYWHKFDTLIDLGLLNLAEKNLAECMETYGAQPMILQRFALINLAKGKTEAARIFLGRLQKTLFHGRWATDYLARLDADPTLSHDPEIQHLRTQGLRKDAPAHFYTKEPMLRALVEQGGGNRMAFEYLMTHYLLTGQLGRFMPNLARLSEFGYTEIPPLWQEAIVVYVYGTKKPVPLGGYAIHPEVPRRIEHFSAIFNRHGQDKDAALPELAKHYYGSYFFYRIYASVPGQK